jgi:hypothetical protein
MYIIKLGEQKVGQDISEVEFVEYFRSESPKEILGEWDKLNEENNKEPEFMVQYDYLIDTFLSTPERTMSFRLNGEFGAYSKDTEKKEGGYGLRLRIYKA